jgi:type II secretory pathway component PulF
VVVLYCGLLCFNVWLFMPGLRSQRVMAGIINWLPGACRIADSMDSARLCGMLSVFLQQKLPLPEALRTVSQLVENQRLSRSLIRIADGVAAGGSFMDVLSADKAVDRLVALTFQHTPEEDLSVELGRLGELYEHRVALSARSAAVTWTILVLIFMTVAVGIVILALFLPLLSIITCMAW